MIHCNLKHLIGKTIVKITDNDYIFNFHYVFLQLETYSERFDLCYNKYSSTNLTVLNPLQLIGIIGKPIKDIFIKEKDYGIDLHIITDIEYILNIKNIKNINIYIGD